MKSGVSVLICGKLRMAHVVYHHLEHYFDIMDIPKREYVLSTDLEEDTEYMHDNNLNFLKKCPKLSRLCFQTMIYKDDYRNALNYLEKLTKGCAMMCDGFDYYMIIRSDLILDGIDFMTNVSRDDTMYFPSLNHNSFLVETTEKINGNFMLTRNFHHIQLLTQMKVEKEDYFDIMLCNYLERINIRKERLDIPSHLLLSLCHIIAISGDSGSGKSTLSDSLCSMFSENIMKLETDRYHKWERGDSNYHKYTHLHPEANFLEKLEDDVYNLRLGNDIYSVDYDHDTGRFTPEEKITPCKNIILCGLHTLWSRRLRSMLSLKIFMDTDEQVRKEWKIQRDVLKRAKTKDEVQKELLRRQQDSQSFITCQRDDADIVVHFYKDRNNILRCNFVCRSAFYNILCLAVRAGYEHDMQNECELRISLLGTPVRLLKIMELPPEIVPNIREDVYGEIQLLIYYYSTQQEP